MAGQLDHSPSEIVESLLRELGLGTEVGDDLAWPVHVSNEPDDPDNCITVYDTAGKLNGKTAPNGEMQQAHGIQIRVRAATHREAFAKIHTIAVTIDPVTLVNIAVDDARYVVFAMTKVTDVIALGRESESNRRLFTVNYLINVRQLS